jgi:hypothetical protein
MFILKELVIQPSLEIIDLKYSFCEIQEVLDDALEQL